VSASWYKLSAPSQSKPSVAKASPRRTFRIRIDIGNARNERRFEGGEVNTGAPGRLPRKNAKKESRTKEVREMRRVKGKGRLVAHKLVHPHEIPHYLYTTTICRHHKLLCGDYKR